jgi:hypothetical protein
MARSDEFPEEIAPDLRQMIRDELDRLPDAYRQAVQLCYLDGLTHQEAARRLGWPLGTVKIRLVRGRRLLRERLDRRGAGLGASLILWLMNPSKAEAVPQALAESTVQAMRLAAAGRSSALAATFPRASEIAEATLAVGVALKMHWLWAVLVVVALSLGLSGTNLLAFHRPMVPDVDPTSLPPNLTNVLTIDCG